MSKIIKQRQFCITVYVEERRIGFVCRLVEIISNKIFNVQKDEAQLECITNAATKLYRIEEIPNDELDLTDDELIVQVAHFSKVCFALTLFAFSVITSCDSETVLFSMCLCSGDMPCSVDQHVRGLPLLSIQNFSS